jgi:hypothetical protein
MFLLPWFFAIVFAIADEIVVGMLLHRQYINCRSAWEADGRPRGVFWIPEETKIGGWYVTYASGHAGQLARWRWLFKSPEWITKTDDARPLMILHRIFLFAFLVCGIAPFAIAAILQ